MRITAIGLSLGMVAFLILLGCSSNHPSTAPKVVHRMGEAVTAGPLIYTIAETQWRTQLGEGATARVPQHRFLLIRLSVTNSGASSSAVPAMALVDGQGQDHLELTDGQGVQEWLGYLRTVNPAETDRGWVVFDVPMAAYRLRVSEDAEPGPGRTALIEIPLRVGSDLPGVPQ
ncbi:MAG: DUF4352 domain-containing protein [Acidobacteria bacterium]|nr:DUF4352 domain-containing protein [Acidobacteriota bacterium]